MAAQAALRWPNEKVLVVKAETIFDAGKWEGIEQNRAQELYDLALRESFYLERDQAEGHPEYQQIIPYLVFRVGERYFVTERLARSGEPRLRGEIATGLGGHINPVDQGMADDVIMAAAKREFAEEVRYAGKLLRFELLGILKTDYSPVCEDHLGMVYLLEGDNEDIVIGEPDKLRGFFVTLTELEALHDRLEGWSRCLLVFLKQQKQYALAKA